MITIHELLSLVEPPLTPVPDALSRRLEAAEARAREAFARAHPRCLWDHIVRLDRSALEEQIRPLGAWDRLAWATCVYAQGDESNQALAQTLFDTLAEALVVNLALANTGTPLGLPAGDPAVEAHVFDLLNRCVSRRITWGWVNRELMKIITNLVQAVPGWATLLPGFRDDEIAAFFNWMEDNWPKPVIVPLADSDPGAALAKELLLRHEDFLGIGALLDAREYVTRPLVNTSRGIYTTSAGSAYGESYHAMLERIEVIYQRTPTKPKGMMDRGNTFEALVRELLHRYLGESCLPPAPHSISVRTKTGRAGGDIDALWLGDTHEQLLVVECKSYAPSNNSSTSATKLDAERAKIIDQLEKRAEALAERRPIETTAGRLDTTTWPVPSLIGVSIDPMMGPDVLPSAQGPIHAFHVEGLVIALRAFPTVTELLAYLGAREQLLHATPWPVTDEADIVRAYATNTSRVVPCTLTEGGVNHVPAADIPRGLAWREYLTRMLTVAP